MKILLVGSLNTIFIYSYADYFLGKGYDVFILNTSTIVDINSTRYDGTNLYKMQLSCTTKYGTIKKIISTFKLDTINVFWWFYSLLFERKSLSQDKYLQVEELLLNNSFDLAFCFWGTSLRKEILALKTVIKSRKLNLKIVLSVSTYPVRYNVPKKKNLSWYFLKKDKAYFELCDGLILSGELMKSVIVDYLGFTGDYILFKDFLPTKYFAENIAESRSDLIFLGNVRFNERTIDNVTQQLIDIADNGIRVWIQEPCNVKHPNINTFKPFTLQEISSGKLGGFLNNFKASVVLYNKVDNLRMGTTFPTRFALATLGRHDIFIPKGVFDTLEGLNENVSTYNDIPDLVNRYTSSESFIDDIEYFSLDGQTNSNIFDSFIKRILANNQ